jgi:microcystin-dependent protein
MEELMGSIQLFAGQFIPQGWRACNGDLLSINQYSALFSLLGTTYGGDGRNNFALPDLRNRVPIGVTTPTNIGQATGSATVTLTQNNLPPMSGTATINTLNATAKGTISGTATAAVAIPSATGATAETVTGNYLADASGSSTYAPSPKGTATLAPFDVVVPINLNANLPVQLSGPIGVAVSTGGQSQPLNIQPPSLGLNYIICVQGIYPSRPD